MNWAGKKVALALGGGGVRGFSHIGVLDVLEEEDIAIDLIAGTSAGALIGGAYAAGLAPREIQAKVDAYLRSPEFEESALKTLGLSVGPERKGPLQKAQAYVTSRYYLLRSFFPDLPLAAQDFQSLIHHFIPDMDIRQTRIPFLAVATDLISGEEIVFREGSLRQAILASCAVPGAIEPVRHGDWLLADGGITSLIPVQAARQAGADVVIAVMVGRSLPPPQIDSAQDIFYRAGEITSNKLEETELAKADVVIRPQVGDLHWMDSAAPVIWSGKAPRQPRPPWDHSGIATRVPQGSRLAGRLWGKARRAP
jgi:NTE family protein